MATMAPEDVLDLYHLFKENDIFDVRALCDKYNIGLPERYAKSKNIIS